MELTLTPEEVALLSHVLSDYLPTLRELVYKTDNYEWRQAYKKNEELLNSLVSRLETLAEVRDTRLRSEAEALLTDVDLSIAPA